MTVCQQCGATRDYIPDPCPSCGFQPRTTRELAIASLLTEEFAQGGNSKPLGTPEGKLLSIASDIRAGRAVTLNEKDIQRHERKVTAFLSHEPNVAYGLYLIFRPALVLVGVLLALWLALRLLNSG